MDEMCVKVWYFWACCGRNENTDFLTVGVLSPAGTAKQLLHFLRRPATELVADVRVGQSIFRFLQRGKKHRSRRDSDVCEIHTITISCDSWHYLCYSPGVFGQSEQCGLVGYRGGSGSESGWGSGGGERRLFGGGVHRLAPAEPQCWTGQSCSSIISHLLSYGLFLPFGLTRTHGTHFIFTVSDVWLQPEQGQAAKTESWSWEGDQGEFRWLLINPRKEIYEKRLKPQHRETWMFFLVLDDLEKHL